MSPEMILELAAWLVHFPLLTDAILIYAWDFPLYSIRITKRYL